MSDNKFSKSDIIQMVVDETGKPKKEVKEITDTVFDKISEVMTDGGVVTIQGFARFFVKEAQPRQFRKINTEEVVEVGRRNLPKAKFSKNFTNKVKESI